MARITVEDCLDKVDNRFQLVMISSKRARQLQIEGKEPLLPVDKDKPTVVALREIADGLVDVEILNEKPNIDLEDLQLEENAESEAGSDAAESQAAASDEAAADDAVAPEGEEPVKAEEDQPSPES